MTGAIRLYYNYKEIDFIWVIIKKFNSWREKKEEKPYILRKNYIHIYNINPLVKQIYDYNYTLDFHSFS